jgi:hypothetical protein
VLDHDAAGTSALPPALYTPVQREVLPPSKSSWELQAKLFEELRCVDVRELLEAATG